MYMEGCVPRTQAEIQLYLLQPVMSCTGPVVNSTRNQAGA